MQCNYFLQLSLSYPRFRQTSQNRRFFVLRNRLEGGVLSKIGSKGECFLKKTQRGEFFSKIWGVFYWNEYSSKSDFIYPCIQMIFVSIIGSLLWSSQLIPTERRVQQWLLEMLWHNCEKLWKERFVSGFFLRENTIFTAWKYLRPNSKQILGKWIILLHHLYYDIITYILAI